MIESDEEYDARREAERPNPLHVLRGIIHGMITEPESLAIAEAALVELGAKPIPLPTPVQVPAEGSRERTMKRRYLLRQRLQHVATLAAEGDREARVTVEIEKIINEVLRIPNTPAEARTGIGDRAAAALVDVAMLRRWIENPGGPGDPDTPNRLDRIEAALRERAQ